jgi:hypothetical protein
MSEPCDGVRSRRAPGHYEWWYFDCKVGEPGLARIEWHAPLFNLQDENCVLALRHYDQQSRGAAPVVWGARYPRSRVEMGAGSCRIRFPAGSIIEEAGNYRIKIAEQAFAADLRFTRLLPPVTSPDGEIIRTADGCETFCWSIPLPRARVAGTLTLDGAEYPVDGPGYHDHNWGNLNLGRRLHRWIWLRVPFESLTLIFARIELREAAGPLHQLVVLDHEGRPIETGSFEAVVEGEKLSACSRLRLPGAIRIRFGREPEYRVSLEVSHIHAVEEEPLGTFRAGWLNTLYARLWYLAGRRRLPRRFRQRAGRLLFLQAAVAAQVTINGSVPERQQGVLEVFDCGS